MGRKRTAPAKAKSGPKPASRQQAKKARGPSRQQKLLNQIEEAGRLCLELERQFGQYPAPALETLLKLHRVLVLTLSQKAQTAPELLPLVGELMRPILLWSQLQERRKSRALAERKYHEQARSRKAVQAQEKQSASALVLTAETLRKIEAELKLL